MLTPSLIELVGVRIENTNKRRKRGFKLIIIIINLLVNHQHLSRGLIDFAQI